MLLNINYQSKKVPMTISEIKTYLKNSQEISFQLPNGSLVPAHFHVTEIGKVSKNFIDCGGTIRHEESANFQLWEENDYNHRLHPEKLLSIIELSETKLGLGDLEIEVEYQNETIGKFALGHNGNHFVLETKRTNCLAKDNCGIPIKKTMIAHNSSTDANSCTPGGRCC